MPKPPKGSRLGAGPAHERLMLAGLAAALFREERIRTTETKARRLRPVAEKLITTAKEGTVASRRRALAVVEDRDVIHKLYADIAPRFADRNGGYTRIIKLAPRKGDAAPLVLIELVEGAAPEAAPTEEERRRRLLRRRSRAAGESKEAEEKPARRARGATAAGAEDAEDVEIEAADDDADEGEVEAAAAADETEDTGDSTDG
ncbi:MAG TPA: 50S ribosomal protein L17 [Actinomycetota bacterium]|nr:50S ribosomal protein L17 [Actinomycetota bacterium]